jgi:hypothetical protein
MKKSGDYMGGLKKSAPSGTEPKPKGGSVNAEPTRSSTAPTPATISGRVA